MNTSHASPTRPHSPFADVSFQPQAPIGVALSEPFAATSRPAVEEVKDHIVAAKQRAQDLQNYVNSGRQEGLDLIANITMEIEGLQQLLAPSGGEIPEILRTMLTNKNNQLAEAQTTLDTLDNQVITEKEIITKMLQECYSADASQYQWATADLEWPSLADCTFLGAPAQYAYNIVANQGPTATNQGITAAAQGTSAVDQDGSILIGQLMELMARQETMFNQRIKEMETRHQLLQAQQPTQTHPVDTPDKPASTFNVIGERRRRIPFTSFKSGTATEAQEWIDHFEQLCHYGKFTETDMLDELSIRLEGPALKWLSGLPTEATANWQNFRSSFVYHYAGGARPTRTALAELKKLVQGNSPMAEFGPKLLDLLEKAGVMGTDLQLDFLWDKMDKNLKEKVVISRPKDLRDAIAIAIELEYALGKINTVVPKSLLTISEVTPMEDVQTTNSQTFKKPNEKRCYYCKKKGHYKSECLKRQHNMKKKSQGGHQQNAAQVETTAVKEQPVQDDIFAHLLDQNEAQVTSNKSSLRIYVTLHIGGQQVKALVDTGSTHSTATETVINRLQIPVTRTAPTAIAYGNKSRQITTKAARIKFKVDDQLESCNLIIVENQNEEIILGMDWFTSAQVLIDPINRRLIWPEY